MIVRAIKNNNDSSGRVWVFGKGLSSYQHEQNAVGQQVKSGLLEFVNDCYFALNNGIDWRTRLGYTNQKSTLDEDIQRVINLNQAVISLDNFQSTMIDRAYMSSCLIYTIYSETPINFTFNQGI